MVACMQVMDALAMTFPDNTFDLVWACESGEHMPDKKKYVEEMTRVLKPGGTLVIACWCQREEGDKPFTQDDKDRLTFLYEEWAHPYFISIEEFGRHMEVGRGVGHTCDWPLGVQGHGIRACMDDVHWPQLCSPLSLQLCSALLL